MSEMLSVPDLVMRIEKSFRCLQCDARFRTALSTHVPFAVAIAEMGSVRCPACGSGPKALTIGESRRRNEDEAERITGSEDDRAGHWHRTGDRGEASQTIYEVMTGRRDGQSRFGQHPDGVGELRQCILLLEHMPEWNHRMEEMAGISPEWKSLVGDWRYLVATYRSEAPNYDRPAPRTRDVLLRIIRAME